MSQGSGTMPHMHRHRNVGIVPVCIYSSESVSMLVQPKTALPVSVFSSVDSDVGFHREIIEQS